MATAKRKVAPGLVKTEAEAKRALLKYREIKDDIAVRMAAAGIPELEEQADELRRQATDWAVKSDKETISLGGTLYARLRRDKYGGTWMATDNDVTAYTPVNVMSMRANLKKKYAKDAAQFREVWNRVTKRAVDPEKLDRVVQEGVLTADEIAPAYYEKDKKPFIQIYGG